MPRLRSELEIANVDDLERKTLPAKSSDKKINVCFLIDELSTAGTEKHLLGLIHDLDRTRFNPTLVLLRGLSQSSQELEPTDCRVIRLGITSFRHPSVFKKANHFVRFLKSEKVNILQMYFPDSTLMGAVCGRIAGVKHLIRTRRNAGYWFSRTYRWRSWFINKLIDSTIANSDASKKSVIRQEFAKDSTVIVIPNGVDLGKFQYRKNWPNDKRKIRIGMLANLRPVKRVQDFVEAAAIVLGRRNDCEFEIGGTGPLQGELEVQIQNLGISCDCRLLGSVSNVPKYLGKLDLLVSCSSSEGLSNTLLEAMSCGVPIVASDIPGNQQLITPAETGLLFDVGDSNLLAEKICSLIDNKECVERIRRNARILVEQHFDQRNAVGRYEKTYTNSMLAGRH